VTLDILSYLCYSRNLFHIAAHLVLVPVLKATTSKKCEALSFQIASGWNLPGFFFT